MVVRNIPRDKDFSGQFCRIKCRHNRNERKELTESVLSEVNKRNSSSEWVAVGMYAIIPKILRLSPESEQ